MNHKVKKSVPSSSSSRLKSSETRSKHIITPSAEDQERGSDSANCLERCYEQLRELENTANRLSGKGRRKEATIFFEKAHETRAEIEKILQQTNDKLHVDIENAERSRIATIQRLVDTNFQDPSPEVYEEARAKGLDLNKISAKILMTEMCREMLEARERCKHSQSNDFEANSNQKEYLTTAYNSSGKGILRLNKEWLSEDFLERVMFKVRRHESKEMATRILDEVTLPSLRVLITTRLAYQPIQGKNCDGLLIGRSLFGGPSPTTKIVELNKIDIMYDKARENFDGAENGADIALELLKKSVKDLDISKASREELSAALIPSLTEDIFEIELQQTQKSYSSLRSLQQQTISDVSSKLKEVSFPRPRSSSVNCVSSFKSSSTYSASTSTSSNLNSITASSSLQDLESKAPTSSAAPSLNQSNSLSESTSPSTTSSVAPASSTNRSEMDDHGDRVYEMMIQRYGSGFDEAPGHNTDVAIQIAVLIICLALMTMMIFVGSRNVARVLATIFMHR